MANKLQNFLVDIVGCKQDWTPSSFIKDTVNLKNKLGNDKVVLGLSGGVDSTVAASFIISCWRKTILYFL